MLVRLLNSPICLHLQSIYCMSKHSRPLPSRHKERTRGKAMSDDKSGKIAKAEQEMEQKRQQENMKKKQEMEQLRASQPKINTWSSFYEYYLPKENEEEQSPPIYQRLDEQVEGKRRLKNKYPVPAYDVSEVINSQFDIKQHEYTQFSFTLPKRTGVIATKVGMTSQWDKWGIRHTLTVVQLDNNQVVQIKRPDIDGYSALQIGAGSENIKKLKKPQIGHFMKSNIPPKRYIKEFPITPENVLPVGYMLTARHFVPGQFVDIQAISNGKGFAGTVKRHNYTMQPATHGCSLSHRMLGSTGQRQDPGRVFKGKAMAGRMGGVPKMVESVRIYKIDAVRQLIYLKGGVPGKPGNILYLKDSMKAGRKNEGLLNYPTLVVQKDKEYAKEMLMEAPVDDPQIQETHENDIPKAGEDAEE